MPHSAEYLKSLKYSELQKLAKSFGIRANQKSEKLLKELQQHFKTTSSSNSKANRPLSFGKNNNHGHDTKLMVVTTVKPTNEDRSTPEEAKITKSDKKSNSIPVKRKRKRTFELEESSLGRGSTPIARSSAGKTLTPKKPTKQEVESSPAQKRVRRGTFEKDGPSVIGRNNSNGKKGRRTFELEEASLGQSCTPNTDTDGKKKRTSRSKSGSNSKTKTKKLSKSPLAKRSTFEKQSPALRVTRSSPSTQAMIQSMDVNGSDNDMKASLLSALDKKVQEKVADTKGDGQQASQIPRFMVFLAKKKGQHQKPLTPGSKDWKKIHNKAFSKFDSIDVYLEKKQQRIDKLTNSSKKPAASPLRKAPAIAKPVVRPTTQLPKPFVPTVVTTRNLSFNFGKTSSTKTPTVRTDKDATKNTVSKTPRNTTLSSARKPTTSVKRETPFMFTGNTNNQNTTSNCLNTTVTSSKKTAFDLKASLSRPLTWKPHTGRLQPLDTNKPGGSAVVKPKTSALPRPSRQAMARKTRQASVKNVKRTQQVDRRNNVKYIEMMEKRGLM